MRMKRRMWRIIIVFLILSPLSSFAGSKLTLEADTVIYSGPSTKYRPLITGKSGQSFAVSKRQAQGREGGEFYKVLVVRQGPSRVGYIPVDAPAHIENSSDSEDVDSYSSFSQADRSFQLGFHGFKDYQFIWTFGYLVYPTDALYLKALGGQLLNQRSGSLIAGGEIGTDQPFAGQFSIYALFATGVFILAEDNMIFEGSRKLDYFAQGGTGLRYTADEHAAFSLGFFQIVLMSPNNSLVSLGASITLEVGL